MTEKNCQFVEEGVIPQQNNLNTAVEKNPKYDQLILEYKAMAGVSLEKFCKGKGVDLDSMRVRMGIRLDITH